MLLIPKVSIRKNTLHAAVLPRATCPIEVKSTGNALILFVF